ncbi:MAG: biotin/lipoyl-containing protein [Candidatus Krumholzibacteriota bacterium]
MLLNFRCQEETVAVEVSRQGDDWRLVVDGREVPLQAFREQGGSWLVDTHQGRRRLWVARKGDQRLVFCDGKVHVLDLPDPEVADDEVDTAVGGGLFAAMPGKVVKVLVQPEARVEAGQAVLILESMKMETELTAPAAGSVTAVHVQDGQLVGQGDALVDIAVDPEDEDS